MAGVVAMAPQGRAPAEGRGRFRLASHDRFPPPPPRFPCNALPRHVGSSAGFRKCVTGSGLSPESARSELRLETKQTGAAGGAVSPGRGRDGDGAGWAGSGRPGVAERGGAG